MLLQELDEVFVTERQAHVRHIAAQRKALPAHLQGEEGLVKIQVGRYVVIRESMITMNNISLPLFPRFQV